MFAQKAAMKKVNNGTSRLAHNERVPLFNCTSLYQTSSRKAYKAQEKAEYCNYILPCARNSVLKSVRTRYFQKPIALGFTTQNFVISEYFLKAMKIQKMLINTKK